MTPPLAWPPEKRSTSCRPAPSKGPPPASSPAARRRHARSQADLSAVAGATVIVIADEVGPPVKEIQGEAGLALLGRVRSHNAAAPIVCAGASQAWLVAHGVAELGIPATHIVGSAPLALVAALKALVALELNGSAQDVSLTLAGQPPQAIAMPWQTASVNGESLERLLDAPALRRIESRVRYLWPPGPYALAAAAARMTEGLIAGCRQTLCGFTADTAAGDARLRRQGFREQGLLAHGGKPARPGTAAARGAGPGSRPLADSRRSICPLSAPSSESRWTRSSEFSGSYVLRLRADHRGPDAADGALRRGRIRRGERAPEPAAPARGGRPLARPAPAPLHRRSPQARSLHRRQPDRHHADQPDPRRLRPARHRAPPRAAARRLDRHGPADGGIGRRQCRR